MAAPTHGIVYKFVVFIAIVVFLGSSFIGVRLIKAIDNSTKAIEKVNTSGKRLCKTWNCDE